MLFRASCRVYGLSGWGFEDLRRSFRFGLSARRTLRLQGFRVWRFSHEALPVQSPGAITSLGCRVWASNGWHVFGFLLACGLNGLIAALRCSAPVLFVLACFMFLPTIRAEFRVYGIAQFETRPYTGNTRVPGHHLGTTLSCQHEASHNTNSAGCSS